MDGLFDQCDANVEDEPPDHVVAEPVDDHQASAWSEHASHLDDRALLIGIVMERVRTRDDVETGVGERQVLAIAGDKTCLPVRAGPAGFIAGDHTHRWRVIDPDDLGVQGRAGEQGRQSARAAADVEQLERPVASAAPQDQLFHHNAMARLEQKVVQQRAIVGVRPGLELPARNRLHLAVTSHETAPSIGCASAAGSHPAPWLSIRAAAHSLAPQLYIRRGNCGCNGHSRAEPTRVLAV